MSYVVTTVLGFFAGMIVAFALLWMLDEPE